MNWAIVYSQGDVNHNPPPLFSLFLGGFRNASFLPLELANGEASVLQTGRDNGCSPKTPPLEELELEAVPTLVEYGGRGEGEGVEGGVEDKRESREKVASDNSGGKLTGLGKMMYI